MHGTILMENNSSSKMINGVGMVCLQMFNGIVRMLEDLYHIPDLKKSLLFFFLNETRKATNSLGKVELLEFSKVQWLS